MYFDYFGEGDIGKGDTGGDFMNLNIARILGEMGAGLSEKGSFGEIVGTGASNWARNKAAQEAGAKQLREHNTFSQQLLKAAADGTLLSPLDDNNAIDSLTVDGDNNVSMKMKSTPKKESFDNEESPLESKRLNGGNEDLPDFLYSSLV